jgi:hypothetical protein
VPTPSSPDRWTVTLFLVLLTLTAGCNSLEPDQSTTQAETVTPAPVPTTSPTRTPVPTVVPGIERNGRVRPAAVVARHQRALQNHSYTVTIRRTVTVVNATVANETTAGEPTTGRRETTGTGDTDERTAGANETTDENGGAVRRETFARAWVATNRSHYRLVQFVNVSHPARITTASDPSVDLWYNGSSAFYRVTDSTGTPYVRASGVATETLSDPTFPLVLRELFTLGRYRPLSQVSAVQPTRFVAVSVNRSAVTPPSPYGRPRNVTARLTLTPEGIVQATRLTYTATGDGERVRIRETTRITAVDETSVPVPPWVPDSARLNETSGT